LIGWLAAVDDSVGRVMDALSALGRREAILTATGE
jgi:hypothetical protein